jgi:hypothetical protein
VANHVKTKNRRQGVVADVDDTRQCPFVEHYDGDLHDVLGNLRRFDGSIETHQQYCPPVNLFAQKGTLMYWVKASWGECIVFVIYMPLLLISLCGRYFLFLVLDKVVCPFLVKYFEMLIWHPTSEKVLDELLDAKSDM